MRKLSNEEVIKRIHERYGDRFDCSNINYVKQNASIELICKKCGCHFTRYATSVLSPHNSQNITCPNCGVKERSLNKFLGKLEKKYGKDAFSFDHDKYVHLKHEITFKCNKCGYEFTKQPSTLLTCKGCPICDESQNRKKTVEEVISLFKSVHGDKYDYSLITEYKDKDSPLPIICHEKDEDGNEHGNFYQSYAKHYKRKQGCGKCNGGIKRTLEYYIQKAQKIHVDDNGVPLYNYSLIKDYQNSKVPVPIICKKHGVFNLSLSDHTSPKSKQGCPFCHESKLEQAVRSFLTEHGIKIQSQCGKSTFEWLASPKRGSYTLDFYLPEYNAAIECQGEQHFKTHDGSLWFTEEKIQKIMERDQLKKQLCENHGIRLFYYSNLGIEYPYHVYEDLEEMLTDIMKGTQEKVL